jgi:hypothetical protein
VKQKGNHPCQVKPTLQVVTAYRSKKLHVERSYFAQDHVNHPEKTEPRTTDDCALRSTCSCTTQNLGGELRDVTKATSHALCSLQWQHGACEYPGELHLAVSLFPVVTCSILLLSPAQVRMHPSTSTRSRGDLHGSAGHCGLMKLSLAKTLLIAYGIQDPIRGTVETSMSHRVHCRAGITARSGRYKGVYLGVRANDCFGVNTSKMA